MTKYILVGGYITKSKDGGKAFCEELVKGIDKTTIKVLDCTFARPREEWQDKLIKDKLFLTKFIPNLELELANESDFTNQVKNADIIFFRGGYSLQLVDLLSKDKNWTKELEGKVLAGTSAGAEAISKYYYGLDTGKVENGLGLLPIKVIVHWHSDYFDEMPQNIDWDKSYNELKNYLEDLPVVTLSEGEIKVFEQ